MLTLSASLYFILMISALGQSSDDLGVRT